MEIPTKKLKNGFELPVYGLGLWQMGGRAESDNSQDDQEIKAIQSAMANGITHFDAAESYGNGHAEELLGMAMRDFDRDMLFIASKVSAWNQGYNDLKKSFETTLKHLGTDYLDLYLLHRYPIPGIPIEETMEAMDELIAEGLVKNIGVCNLSVNRFKEAQKHTRNKIVCNQVHYNVQYREVEHRRVLEYCQENDVMLVAWRPLQKGNLLPPAPLISELAEKYGKTPAQIMIDWLISQDNVVTISKTSNMLHLKDNLGAIGWNMEKEDVERIRAEYPDQQEASDAVPMDFAADVAVQAAFPT